jgi:hypothetical protein
MSDRRFHHPHFILCVTAHFVIIIFMLMIDTNICGLRGEAAGAAGCRWWRAGQEVAEEGRGLEEQDGGGTRKKMRSRVARSQSGQLVVRYRGQTKMGQDKRV